MRRIISALLFSISSTLAFAQAAAPLQLAEGAPDGYVMLIFAGDAALRLHVECIEAELRDLGAAWQTARRPQHDDEPR